VPRFAQRRVILFFWPIQSLVAEPDFYRLAACLLGDSRHDGREVFLKVATAAASWA
jgi:hypothetical protein